MSVTFLIVDPWPLCVCFIRSGVTRCILLTVLYLDLMCQCGLHRYTYASPRCRTLQYSRTFIPFSVSLWNDLANSVFDGVGLAGFKSRANAYFFGLSCSIPTIVFYSFSLSLLSAYRLVLWGWGLRTDMVYITLSQPGTLFLNNNNNNCLKNSPPHL